MGNLVFGSGAEPGRASKARGGLTESPMERDYDATESDRERYNFTNFTSIKCSTNIQVNLFTTFHIHSVQLRHASNKVYTHERGKLVQT